jgi:hypothetical protein
MLNRALIITCIIAVLLIGGCSTSSNVDSNVIDESSIPVVSEDPNGQVTDQIITITVTVAGMIQTEDPWTTGAMQTNEWAKPMYYIWLDDNGRPGDGPYGNGQGPYSYIISFDTGRLNFRSFGTDRTWNTADDVTSPWNKEVSPGGKTWVDVDHGVKAVIVEEGKALSVSFPLSLINNPKNLEIAAMASPWTTSALDNLGSGSGNNGWINYNSGDLLKVYIQSDSTGDTRNWPNINPNNSQNFDIVSLAVTLTETDIQDSDRDGISDYAEKTLAISDPNQYDLELWSVEFNDPSISSDFNGRRYFFYTTASSCDENDPKYQDSYDRVIYGAIAENPASDWEIEYKIYYQSSDTRDLESLATKIIRLMLHCYWYSNEYLGYTADNKLPQGFASIWLSNQRTGAEQYNDNMYFYTKNMSGYTSETWVRLVTHEYGHLVIKGVGEYNSSSGVSGDPRATERWTAGYLGERLFARWFQRNLSGSLFPGVNEWDSDSEVWDQNGVSNWQYYENSDIKQLFNGESPTDERVITLWQNNKSLMEETDSSVRRLKHFYAFIGLALDIEASSDSLGPEALKSILNSCGYDPVKFYTAYKNY